MGHQGPHGNVESQKLGKYWKLGTLLLLANEFT